jgi:signal transduction histidine kinase
MRGGLGRTLLVAFLLLSIVPLGVVSFVAATQARQNLQHELEEKLIAIASLTESHLREWASSKEQLLATLANLSSQSAAASANLPSTGDKPINPKNHSYPFIVEAMATQADVLGWAVVDEDGQGLATVHSSAEDHRLPKPQPGQSAIITTGHPVLSLLTSDQSPAPAGALMLSQSLDRDGRRTVLVSLFSLARIAESLKGSGAWNHSGSLILAPSSGQALELQIGSGEIQAVDHFERTVYTVHESPPNPQNYENHQGIQVIGIQRWLPDLGASLVIEESRESALAPSDDLAVVLIGSTLGVVLLTALTASAVTRRLTLPIIELTATAVQVASGDLQLKVPATRRDELGILARAFNVMTTKLRILYEDLEYKVWERTQQLCEANSKIRYRAMQLAISAEVGRVVTSILDRELLLERVVELTRDCFQAAFVAVYLLDETANGREVVFQEGTGRLGAEFKAQGHRLGLDDKRLVSLAAKSSEPWTRAGSELDDFLDRVRFSGTRAELAVPLRIGERVLGVLDVHRLDREAFDEDEIMVLETLAGQISVAIENARAYELERQASAQLRDVEQMRRHFLRNMSHALRIPLNNIIGFSRVMLKEIDGPISELQQQDLSAIHDSGQRLLGLINDILDVAHLDAGAMDLDIRAVDIADVAEGIEPTVKALLHGRPIEFRCQISQNLPPVRADANRLRQVLVKLLSNAAQYTRDGRITLRIWRSENEVVASVSDTGIGIPEEDRDKVYEMFRQLSDPVAAERRGAGLGLTLSKGIVEIHGGTMWLESAEGQGTTFTFTLPAWEARESISCGERSPL